MADRSQSNLSFDDIVTLAERESGAHGLADAGLLGRVRHIVDWINERGPYPAERVDAMRRQVQNLLARRMKMIVDRQRFEGITKVAIERPIFVIGFARAGTTLLHSLLAEDPEANAPTSWHMYSPSPPPGAGPVVSQRLAYADREVQRWSDFCPAQRTMHPYIDKGAQQLIEDEETLALDFRNTYCYHYHQVPTMETFLVLEPDQTDAFRFHRQYLQHFQWNTGKSRWNCKGPTHQGNLAALFDVYPDALCIWPHRPMDQILPSIITLSAAIYDTITGKPTDLKANGRMVAEMMKAGFDHMLANALVDDPRVMHVPFQELTADPVSVIRQAYDRIGRSVSTEHETRIRNWLDDPENGVERYGRYPYSFEAVGLDRDWVKGLFAEYSARFGLD